MIERRHRLYIIKEKLTDIVGVQEWYNNALKVIDF